MPTPSRSFGNVCGQGRLGRLASSHVPSRKLALVLGALVVAAAGVLAWARLLSYLVLARVRVPGQGHPRPAHLGACRCLLRARVRTAPLAVDPRCRARRGHSETHERAAHPRPPDAPRTLSSTLPASAYRYPNRMGWTVRVRLPRRPGARRLFPRCRAARPRLARPRRPRHRRPHPAGSGSWPPAPTRSTSVDLHAASVRTAARSQVGMLETGQPWVIDFRVVPHWLNAGATQSGKSNLANAIISRPGPAARCPGRLRPQRRRRVHPLRTTPVRARHHPRRRAADLLDDLVPARRRPDGTMPRPRRTGHLAAARTSCGRSRSWSWSMKSPSCS